MNERFECGDSLGLVTYLYDECGPAERQTVAAHLSVCPACAAELAALDSTRVQLRSWTPPEAELGFRVVPAAEAARVLRPARWWQRPLPSWTQAAAAVLIFGVGLWLGVLRGEVQESSALSAAGAGENLTPVVAPSDLDALEQRLLGELSRVRAEVAAPPAQEAPPAAVSEAEVLARVSTLVEESEQRQRRELALRTAEVVRDFDAQRQFDWTRVQQALGQFEGTTGAEIQRQRQELNNLIRVSQQPR